MKWVREGSSKLLIVLSIITLFILFTGQTFADDNADKSFEELLMEWEEEGIDANHTDAIDKIRNYLHANVASNIFSSLHIEREERPLGVIVLSFTEEISEDMKNDIASLVEEPAKVDFRVVEYSEEQLNTFQDEVNSAAFENKVFEDEGITVHHTSTNIFTNKMEIGISPYTEENIKVVYDYFDNDMLDVVEGFEAQTLTEASDDAIDTEDALAVDEEPVANVGFFTRIWNWLVGLFG